ncbi:MAG: PH domain-containing protein [Methanosphaera sp.]|nr:PH domain-containing protein [Methanosphaera sp.]
MGFLSQVIGHADIGGDISIIEEYLFENETVIQSFHFLRDSIILTNLGIYTVDIQGLSGKKVEVKFFPKKTIRTISFETAGTFDIDADIKIGVTNNPEILPEGGSVNVPITFKVPSNQTQEAKQIIKLIKKHYLCD